MKSLGELKLKKEELKEDPNAKKYTALKVKTALYTQIMKKSFHMVTEYRQLIKHTGGMLTASMGFAYAKGINDTLKLIAKENIDEIMEKETLQQGPSTEGNEGNPGGVSTTPSAGGTGPVSGVRS